jgi:hypothetical protein
VEISLRSDDPTQRMTPRQDNPTMIDLWRWTAGLVERGQACPLDQSAAACGTPVHGVFQSEHGMALTANPFHTQKLTGSDGS